VWCIPIKKRLTKTFTGSCAAIKSYRYSILKYCAGRCQKMDVAGREIPFKMDGWMNVLNYPICPKANCGAYAYFNVEGQTTALYCSRHKSPAMISVHYKKCEFPNCYGSVVNIHNATASRNLSTKFCFQHSDELLPARTRRAKK
jgi:hypothetical protein